MVIHCSLTIDSTTDLLEGEGNNDAVPLPNPLPNLSQNSVGVPVSPPLNFKLSQFWTQNADG